MATYKVTAPEKVTGEVAGATFVKGVAEVDDTNRAALAYFRRHDSYTVEPAPEPPASPPSSGDGDSSKVPSRSASKADWVAHATSPEGGMTEAAAEAMTRDQLAEKFLGPKQD